jgi:hypothetical protein
VPYVVITEDEAEWPEYGIIMADAGTEVDQELIDEYERARAAWAAVQDKLRSVQSATVDQMVRAHDEERG